MLKKLAVALVAVSVFAAPVLAATGSTGAQNSAAKPTVSAIAKTGAPTRSVKHVKRIRHSGKHVRNFRHGKVANFSGKHRTAIKSTGHVVKGPRLAAHKGSNTSAVR
jgi:Ni/Co efflux regulator RcnB